MPTWAYGVQTVYSRVHTLLPKTLYYLNRSGFDRPRLFIDGAKGGSAWEDFGLECTFRYPLIRPYGNWILALGELYIRHWECDLFAIFQDDLECSINLREYLERTIKLHEKFYYNLYTFPENQILCPPTKIGWFPTNQLGKGALALVFTRRGVVDLLSNQHSVARVQNHKRGYKAIDGGVVTALNNVGYKELCHNPSLVQHTGLGNSAIGEMEGDKGRSHPLAISYRGSNFDCLSLLK